MPFVRCREASFFDSHLYRLDTLAQTRAWPLWAQGPRCSIRSKRVYSDTSVDYSKMLALNLPGVLLVRAPQPHTLLTIMLLHARCTPLRAPAPTPARPPAAFHASLPILVT